MKNQVLEKATSHFAQHPEALTEAKAKLFRLKRRRPDPPVPTTEVKPLSQRAKNPMKGQPLRLRLRPALMLHFLNSEAKSLDISPQLTYQATGRLAVGVGVTHRQFFQLDFPVFPNYAHIYGGRVLAEYSLWKSFFAHAELESLHRPAGTSLAGDAHHQQWVKNVPIGLGKHFSLGKRIQAQTLMMYSVTNPAYNLYPTRWLFRMGFKLMPKETSKEKEKTNSASSESTTHL